MTVKINRSHLYFISTIATFGIYKGRENWCLQEGRKGLCSLQNSWNSGSFSPKAYININDCIKQGLVAMCIRDFVVIEYFKHKL